MVAPILATKLYIPPPRPKIVHRPRLFERLDEGLYRKLTLVSAPAGFGKTTLVSDWLYHLVEEQGSNEAGMRFSDARPLPRASAQFAWLSLDEGDNDPIRFLTYLIAALQTLALDEIKRNAPKIGEELLTALRSYQPPPVEATLIALLNEIAAIPESFLLVLDDYHLIEALPVDKALTFLLDHLPSQMHVVITTREDPQLPLARLRVRDEMTELRAADLRFTPAEAAGFLNQAMDLNLSTDEITALETRTEGWIAGLQMAALALQGLAEPGPLSTRGPAATSDFIRAFTGSHRFVLDYLVEEVLQRQPEQRRNFLLQTSILDRLSGPLCDAVLSRGAGEQRGKGAEEQGSRGAGVQRSRGAEEQGCRGAGEQGSKGAAEQGSRGAGEQRSRGAGEQGCSGEREKSPLLTRTPAPLHLNPAAFGQETLEYLDRANLFVVPLDDERRWYRYHHLFADVLQARLMKEQPDQISRLHQRAGAWYEQNDLPAEAIHHAFAAEDFERAARLIELVWPALFNGFQPATWLGWVTALPDELVRVRPVLNMGGAWTLLDGGELEEAEVYLRNAERWLDAATADLNAQPETPTAETRLELDEGQNRRMVVVNDAAFRTFPASIASARAYLAQAQGDAPAAVKNARRALDLLPEGDHYWRGGAAMFLGLAYWSSGELETAASSLADAIVDFQMAGNNYFQIVNTVFLAGIRVAQGRLHEAAASYEQAVQLATEQGQPAGLEGTADLYIGLAELHREWGNLDVATQHLMTGKELGEQAVLLGSEARWGAAMARIKEAQGDLDGALDLLQQAERIYRRDPAPDVYPIAALKAQVWVSQGRLKKALTWARERGLSADDDLSYLSEFDHITLARILIAQFKSDGAEDAIQQAMGLLDRLLQAAEAGGRVGSVIQIMILQALAHEAQDNIASALVPLKRALTLAEPEGYLRIFVDEGQPMQPLLAESLTRGSDAVYVTQLLTAINEQTGDRPAITDPNQLLVEPLSNRELEVLRLLAVGRTNQAVADELVIAVSTVKKHVNNIFGKLGVSSRTQAVNRARELDLLSIEPPSIQIHP